jgi:hypothetical protein
MGEARGALLLDLGMGVLKWLVCWLVCGDVDDGHVVVGMWLKV